MIEKFRRNRWLLLLFFVAVVLRTLYALCINFEEVNLPYFQDYTQIYLIGLKSYTSQIWPYWGPDIVHTSSQIPGALQGLLVGLPFYLWESPEAPFILVNILSGLSLLFFGWYLSKRISNIPKWFVYGWLFLSPWTMHYGTTTINPSYILAPSVVFFVCIIDLLPIYSKRIIPGSLSYFLIALSLGWIMQIHMSWVLLPFYILIPLYFLIKSKNFNKVLMALLFLGLGFILSISTIIPTLIKYSHVFNSSESVIVFNPSNFRNVDILTRFISFSTFEVRYFAGDFNEVKMLIQDNIWAAPFIIVLSLAGITQVIYYIVSFFRKTNRPEFKYVKIITGGSIILVYISYLFAINNMANYTFYLMFPIAFWFSFYCLEDLFTKALWRKFALFFLLSSIVFHGALAKNNFKEQSLFSRRNMIKNALTMKDSRLFSARRIANWEREEQKKAWKHSIYKTSKDSIIQYSNNFDNYPPEIIPETLNKTTYYSEPYSCQIDNMNRFSPPLIVDQNRIGDKRKIKISMAVFSEKINDFLLVISINRNDSNLYWTGEKIIQNEASLNHWSEISLTKEIPEIVAENAFTSIMTWLPESETNAKILIDDVKIEFE